jgi:hypothetical protein
MKRLGVFPIIILLNLLFVTNAQVIYVDNSFSGENPDGSIDFPYTSIQQAVDSAEKGSEIWVKKGTYREQVEIAMDSITIRNYPGEKVVVKGSEAVLSWDPIGNEVYKAIVPWDITENDEANQVFVDGKMIHLTRWPDETNEDWIVYPSNSLVDKAENSGTGIIIEDKEFDEPAERWLNSMVWINLAKDHDGQGWTGEISYISGSTGAMKVNPTGSGIHAASGHDPWAVQRGSKFYLFNPAPAGVYATGGPEALLSRGEWWKNGDTLFIRMPNGEKPASTLEEDNLVEVKKRLWAFIPRNSDYMNNVTIKGFDIFAASISTDRNYTRGNLAINSYNNVIDSIHAKYVTHFIDQSGHYQSQWYSRTGIILSGIENTIQNSIIQYGAAAAVTAFGERHKVWNNRIYEVNYQVTETGALCSAGGVPCTDPDIGYNLFYNIPQKTIQLDKMKSSDPLAFGLIRVHHNVIMNFMLRNSDSGAMNASAGRDWDRMRIDHNVMANANNFLALGVYTDYGGEALVDHNLIWNVERPMGYNRFPEPTGEIHVYNNTVIADSWNKPGIYNNHVNPSGEGMYFKNNIVSDRIKASLELAEVDSNLYIGEAEAKNIFKDFENFDYTLSENASSAIDMGIDVSPYNDTIVNDIPDIGAFEYGAEPWRAGPAGIVTNIKIDAELPDKIYQQDTIYFTATAFTSGFIKMEPQPTFYWGTDGSGRIDQNGMYIADSIDSNAKIFVTADSLLISSKKIKILELVDPGIPDSRNIHELGNDKLDFSLYPNPANDHLYLLFNQEIINDEITIKVFDIQGTEVKLSSWTKQGKTFYLNTGNCPRGIYFIKVYTPESNMTKKFVVQ